MRNQLNIWAPCNAQYTKRLRKCWASQLLDYEWPILAGACRHWARFPAGMHFFALRPLAVTIVDVSRIAPLSTDKSFKRAEHAELLENLRKFANIMFL